MQISSATPPSAPASSAGATLGASTAAGSAGGNAVADFMAYASETPAQQMRDTILRQLGLTENDLKAMSPQDRAKVEQKIKDLIKQKVEQSTEKKTGVIVDVKA
jgi:hypothetical protein